MAIEDTVSLLTMNLENKKLELRNKIPKNTVVFADYNMVNTILRNLLSNAIKFSHEGSRIEIITKETGRFVQISVKDFGLGINQEEQNKLFQIGHNIARDGTANEKGTGLGLLVCKEFVDRHKGKIWLESEPGEGTTFFFTLPKTEK